MDVSSVNPLAANLGVPREEPAAPGPPAQERQALIQAVRAVNAAELFGHNNELTFVLDRATRRAIVRIVDRKTREVVDQIPAEYVLRMAEELNRT
jgi:flagellar protein FlaG